MSKASPTRTGSPTFEYRPGVLSALWLYVVLNTLFRDIHEIFRPGFITELTTGDLATSDAALTLAALAIQLPLAMIVLNLLLPTRVARPANIAIAALVAASVAGTWPKDADDLVFNAFQILGLAAIAAISWRQHPHTAPDRR